MHEEMHYSTSFLIWCYKYEMNIQEWRRRRINIEYN